MKQSLPTKYTKQAEEDVVTYLSFEGVNHNDLSPYVGKLLELKYDLRNGSLPIELANVAGDHLLKLAMHKLILANPFVEMFLTGIRASLLKTMMETSQVDIQEVDLAIALSMQQFMCEYTYLDTDAEQLAINQLIIFLEKISSDPNTKIDTILAPLILISMYCPLCKLSANETLAKVPLEHWPEIVRGLVSLQIIIPYREARCLSQVSRLKPIEDSVSTQVQTQYEQNPYPRWHSANFVASNNYLKDVTKTLSHYTPPNSIKDDQIKILVAGCGTGKQVIELAKSYPLSTILAIDLSQNSIAYAMLKCEEYEVTNVEFLQADILDLEALGRTFDVIESVGVLHHLEEPEQGWKILTNQLAPNGIIKIGLYSKLARRHISEAREIIADNKIETSNLAIRQFRKAAMIGEYGEAIRDLACNSIDFYSMSGCRDLFFHVQEHQFDCIQIKQTLEKLNLEFLGFCQTNKEISREYQKLEPQNESMNCLKAWAKAEQKHPNSFGKMYQFWCQKKTST